MAKSVDRDASKPPGADPKPRYPLGELLAESDYSRHQAPDERERVDAPAIGDELV